MELVVQNGPIDASSETDEYEFKWRLNLASFWSCFRLHQVENVTWLFLISFLFSVLLWKIHFWSFWVMSTAWRRLRLSFPSGRQHPAWMPFRNWKRNASGGDWRRHGVALAGRGVAPGSKVNIHFENSLFSFPQRLWKTFVCLNRRSNRLWFTSWSWLTSFDEFGALFFFFYSCSFKYLLQKWPHLGKRCKFMQIEEDLCECLTGRSSAVPMTID